VSSYPIAPIALNCDMIAHEATFMEGENKQLVHDEIYCSHNQDDLSGLRIISVTAANHKSWSLLS
jgi:hypothetical protein